MRQYYLSQERNMASKNSNILMWKKLKREFNDTLSMLDVRTDLLTFETVGNVLTSMGYLAVDSPNFAQLHSSVWQLLSREEVVNVKNLIVFVAAVTNTYVSEENLNSGRTSID